MIVKGEDITLKVLAQMAADNLKPKWINVEDRLPEQNYRLWIVWRVSLLDNRSPATYDVCEWDGNQQTWYGWDSELPDVTHWLDHPLNPPEVTEVKDE